MKHLTCSLLTLLFAVSGHAQQKTQPFIEAKVFGDRTEQQVMVEGQLGRFNFIWQNQASADHKTALTHLGLGANFKLPFGILASVTAGPQYSFQKDAVDRAVVFAKAKKQFTRKLFSPLAIASINRLSFGRTYVHRHITKVSGVFPLHLDVVAEELVAGTLKENRWGLEKRWGWKGLSVAVNPCWDFSRRLFDLRATISYRFSL